MKQRGFTLLELLVVIAIIGLLATIAVAALGNARVKARDTKRIADLKQVVRALEFYYDDNGAYPIQTSYNIDSGDNPTTWIPGLVAGGHIGVLPVDPINDTGLNNEPWWNGYNKYTYQYTSFDNYQEYNLITKLEDPNNVNTCANLCWVFNTDGGTREGEVWCGNTAPTCTGARNFSTRLYSTYKAF